MAVGEEDEGRRTYGRQAHGTASPEGANISAIEPAVAEGDTFA